METREIQKLIDFISKSDLDEVNIETAELKLKIKRNTETKVINNHAPSAVATPAPTSALPIVTSQTQQSEIASTPPSEASEAPSDKLHTITSPMIGTFYRSGGPDKPNFVEIGDEIGTGKVVCIIEAMKLFNEIESEVSGKIVKILVPDATPVEFDQPLFLVELD